MALGALGGWEPLLLLVLIALVIGLDLAVLLHLFRDKNLSRRYKYSWTVAVLLLPLVGALAFVLMHIFQKND